MVLALPVIALGLIVLLLVFLLANPAFREATRAIVGSIPLIGGWLASNVTALYAGLLYQINRQAVFDLNIMARLFQWLADHTTGYLAAQVGAIQAQGNALWRIRYQTIPLAQRQAEQFAATRALHASQYARGLAGLAVRYSQTLWASGIAYTRSAVAQAEAWTLANLARGLAYARTLFALQVNFALGLFVRATARADAQAAAGERYTQETAKVLSGYTRELFATAINRADQEFQVAEGFARKLAGDQAAYTDLRAGQTMTYTAAAVGVVAAAITAIERSPCMQRCDTLGNLGAELEVLDLGAILALIEMAASNPRGTAQFVNSEVVPLVRGNASMVRGAL